MFYDRFIELCNSRNEKPSAVAISAGISKSLVSKWKKNKSETPSMETVEKLAKYFNIPIADLLEEGIVRCEECGFLYDSGDPEERELHRTKHQKMATAIEKFGFYWDQTLREKTKSDARAIANDESLPKEERAEAQIVVFKALFYRSLMQSDFDLDHPDFGSYCAMLLNQGPGKHFAPTDLHTILVETFGTKEGIFAGTIFNKKTPSVNETVNKGDSVLSNLTENEIRLVYDYAERLIDLRHKQ